MCSWVRASLAKVGQELLYLVHIQEFVCLNISRATKHRQISSPVMTMAVLPHEEEEEHKVAEAAEEDEDDNLSCAASCERSITCLANEKRCRERRVQEL